MPPVAFAIVYAGLGKNDDAFHWLELAADERDGLLIYLKVGSAFDNLRSDVRFSEILTRVGLQGDSGLDVPHPLPNAKVPETDPEPILAPEPRPGPPPHRDRSRYWQSCFLGLAIAVAGVHRDQGYPYDWFGRHG